MGELFHLAKAGHTRESRGPEGIQASHMSIFEIQTLDTARIGIGSGSKVWPSNDLLMQGLFFGSRLERRCFQNDAWSEIQDYGLSPG